MSGVPPIKSGSIRETVNAFLADEEDSQLDTEKEPSVTSYTTENSLSMDISDMTRNTKEGEEKMSRTGSVSTENSFSVLEDIRNYSKPVNLTNPSMLSAENLSTMAAIDSMVMDSQGKLIPREISEDDALSLSTDHSFSGIPNKLNPQVTKILVLEKGRRKKPSYHDLPIVERRKKSSSQNLNPHIVLVEPEHSTGGDSSEQEIDSHILPTRRESVGSLDQHLQVDSRKRAKSFPYEDTEHSITPLTLSPNRSPTLTPMLSPVMEEGENSKLAGFKKFALLKLRARRWMKRSGIATETIPVNHEIQNQRPLVEIPRALKLAVWKEAHPTVLKMYESYKDSLGEHDPLTKMAASHLETHKANFEGTS